jgi:hypothetical protein
MNQWVVMLFRRMTQVGVSECRAVCPDARRRLDIDGRKKTGPKAGFSSSACRSVAGGSGSVGGSAFGRSTFGGSAFSGSGFFHGGLSRGGSRGGGFGSRSRFDGGFFFLAASGQGNGEQGSEQDGVFHSIFPYEKLINVEKPIDEPFTKADLPTASILAKR